MLRPRHKAKNEDPLQPAPADDASILHSISRFWIALLIIAILIYSALLAIGRTDGFRNLVEQKVEAMSGLRVSIEKAHIGFDLHFRIRNLKGRMPGTNDTVALEVGAVKVRPLFFQLLREDDWPLRSLEAENMTISFQRADGAWAPMPVLADAIAPWMNVGASTNASGYAEPVILDALLKRENRLTLLNARIIFFDEQQPGEPVGLAEGIFLETVNLKPFEDRALWSRIKIQSLQNGGQAWMSGLSMEWIRQGDQDVILRIEKESDAGSSALPPPPVVEP